MARERYLLGAGEDTIHSGVIELKTAKDKRANWWFYHKNHLIIGIIMTIVVGSQIGKASGVVHINNTGPHAGVPGEPGIGRLPGLKIAERLEAGTPLDVPASEG